MKYSEYKHEGIFDIKRVESKYHALLGGHLVIVQSTGSNMVSAAIYTDPETVWGRGKQWNQIHSLKKEDLLDLKECIDKALTSFESLNNEESNHV